MAIRFLSSAILTAQIAYAADASVADQLGARPLKLTAGQEIDLTINNATEVGSGYVGEYETTHIKIVMYNMLHMSWMCSLTDFLPAKDGIVKITIPPEMGPSGTYYEISAWGYSLDSASSLAPKHIITGHSTQMLFLSGGEGHWIPAETARELRYYGLPGWENADIPCRSYPCAQACAVKQFPDDSAWVDGSVWMDCLTACDGVVVYQPGLYGYSAPHATSSVSLPQTLPTPTGSCEAKDFRTPCGTECCRESEYCYGYTTCVNLPIDFAAIQSSRSSQSTATATRTGEGSSQKTGTGGVGEATTGTGAGASETSAHSSSAGTSTPTSTGTSGIDRIRALAKGTKQMQQDVADEDEASV
ncbi:hypothetical protein TruAng_010695 [Truncatella angustata]|nr:hypothetical protein TruAng_010695 [Truncatella angustata]